ncbi:MAG: PolC-type DNA polymerase III [Sulfobacillus thermosulfidooxidans]|uniref:DNA polymerase III PolC-type n=1 Tax=Sulfobacillus thermosulfidooxidans TaxID=28034 RepID=A0A2T2WZL9_SULTH|nr:MAG: PolC-type DNA polymerase III [Sulfobacillus thermosulfidooxidans]
MLTDRLQRWLNEEQIPTLGHFEPLWAEVSQTQIRIVLVEKSQEGNEGLRRLADHLSNEWGRHVVWDEYPWSSQAGERLQQIFSLTGSGIGQLLDPEQVHMGPEGIFVTFPNNVAYKLFEQWGGVPRLQRYWPGIPTWHGQVLSPAPPEPDPVLPFDVSSPSSPSNNVIGNGVPDGEAIPIDTLPEGKDVVVLGQIVSADIRVGRDNLRHWSAVLTDMHHAVRLRYSERRGQAFPDMSLLAPGVFVKVQGQVEEDKYNGEKVLRVKHAGIVTPMNVEVDNAPRKRIELHVHSRMSAGDALINLPDLFQHLKTLGHSHVAIVDHAVVQTYPELESLSKKTGIQAIYGVEVNMVDDRIAPLTGYVPEVDGTLENRPIVVLDVETTGLSPRIHEVIELGAVKIESGTIVDRFHSMLKPTRKISQATQDITGIRIDEVLHAPDSETVFRDFFAFASGAILAAHNARFDMGFMSQAFRRVFPHDAWRFPVIDTLALARIRLPEMKSHGLGPLTNYLKIPLSQHHRALADAEAIGLLLLKLLQDQDGTLDELANLAEPVPIAYSIGRPTPVTVLLRSQDGIEALYRLISASHLETFHRVPRVRRQLLEQGRQYWLLGSPLHGGEVQDALFRGASEADLARLATFYDYWEVGPVSAVKSLTREENLGDAEQVQQWIADLIGLGQKYGKPTPAVSDAHYIRPDQKIFREILATTAKGELHDADDDLHFRTTDEMLDAFEWLPGDVRQKIVIDDPWVLAQQIPPIKPVPDGLFSPKLDEAEKTIQDYPIARAKALYGDPLPEIIQARLDKEIRSIVQNGFSSIYYIAHRLVKKSLDDGYLVGSRGSVGSSLVATFLDITEVNPLPPHYRCPSCRYTEFVTDGSVGSGFDLPQKDCPRCQTRLIGDGQDIPFETFLGFEGDKVPDIDLNFSGEYQPEIHKYTEVLFGEGHVFRAGTIATIAQKTAIGLVLAWAREKGREVSGAELEWLASGITGVKRTTGQHPGGLMVVPRDEDIHHFCPVQHPADDRNSDIITTHFDYHSIEGRLLKLDLLGHDDPTAIRMLEDLTGISAKSVPFQDEKTMSLFRDVQALGVKAEDIGTPVGSLGIPEFGTSFVRRMLIDTKPKTFAELVRISGLSHGTEVWANNAQDIIRQNLGGLSDVIATRDDIMLYLIARGIEPKAAFSISESVRKGKGLKPEQEALMKEHNVPNWYIESCRKISYLFPKAHAAAYVMMGWRIAWFKVYYPLAFYATYFSVRASDFDPEPVLGGMKAINKMLADIEEKGNQATAKEKGLVTVLEIARELLARGFRFYPVSLEKSHATRFEIEEGGLRIPFAALPGLGQAAAENIIQARQEAPFLSVDDLRQRARLSKSVIDLLRAQGALKDLGETNQLAFF